MDIANRQPAGLHTDPYLAQCQTTVSNDQRACRKPIKHLRRSGATPMQSKLKKFRVNQAGGRMDLGAVGAGDL
ncbi:hypothetical protein PEX1_014530 [Penicillium expansum]|uniref:Uncharacterized protein n=1 Tax=Penicillium expansum TaxID=27334 RepID=A0A0A2K649_PENEN|nr:hypothetical protein PEX2_017500 [Penicillium expansum]KGO46889.1 hypothetical protein PEXP_065790 [Penicillium expansum]KGO62343.1 hypothetical protein PEX2_017500 [Penicillium expansum]KGO67182.1 hypothetical protein PEX1_014530 [Penicillium expansum]